MPSSTTAKAKTIDLDDIKTAFAQAITENLSWINREITDTIIEHPAFKLACQYRCAIILLSNTSNNKNDQQRNNWLENKCTGILRPLKKNLVYQVIVDEEL